MIAVIHQHGVGVQVGGHVQVPVLQHLDGEHILRHVLQLCEPVHTEHVRVDVGCYGFVVVDLHAGRVDLAQLAIDIDGTIAALVYSAKLVHIMLVVGAYDSLHA